VDNGAMPSDRRQGEGMRLFAVLLVVVLALPSAPAQAAQPRAGLRHALAVLHGWDTQRARAWAGSDDRALARLYVPGSSARSADEQLLRSYTARGFVVRRLVTQVFGARLLTNAPDRLVLRVLDRVAGGEVATPEGAVPLPSTRPAVRRIVLERVGGAWRVASVTGWSPAG
jgi:hypothetical protein